MLLRRLTAQFVRRIYDMRKITLLKTKIRELLKFGRFALYPPITLLVCTIISGLFVTLLGIAMIVFSQKSNWYNIVFALATGAIASFFVSFIVEQTSNYKHNKLAWHEFGEYYLTLINYENIGLSQI